jgi:hypothetical protein
VETLEERTLLTTAFAWAHGFGSTEQDIATSVATDKSGNVYISGVFGGTVDFDAGPSVIELTSSSLQDTFVLKFDHDGDILWARNFGGQTRLTGDINEFGRGIAVDSTGNVYTTGSYEGTAVDFDPGPGTFFLPATSITPQGDRDIFVSKLDSAGNFVWAKRIGGGSSDVALGVALDASNNVLTTGYFRDSADFDPGPGAYTINSFSSGPIFVSKLDADGNFVWAQAFATGGQGLGIAVDAASNIYTTGYFEGTGDFDPGPGSRILTPAGYATNVYDRDIFVSKLDVGGNLVWAHALGGDLNEHGGDVAIDAFGNVLMTGFFTGTADFDPGSGVYTLSNGATSNHPGNTRTHLLPNSIAPGIISGRETWPVPERMLAWRLQSTAPEMSRLPVTSRAVATSIPVLAY